MKPFFIVWSGQAVSLLGSQLVQFGIIWWLTKTTGSATTLALASLFGLLPQIFIGPFAGALVDRWSRKKIMIVADASIALATLCLVVLFWLGHATAWMIYLLLFIRATGQAFHMPAMQASTTLMVPQKHLARIGGLNQALFGVAGIIIPPLGALAVEALPMQSVLAVDVITAIPAILALLFVTIPQPVRAALPAVIQPSLLNEMREGLRFILKWRALMIIVVTSVLIYLLGRAAGSLAPLLVMQHFQGGATELGWFSAAGGIGGLLGGLILGAWGGFRRKVVAQYSALALDGLVIALVALTPVDRFGLVLVGIFASNLLEAIILGLGGALGQILIPPEMQGRVFSLVNSLSFGLAPLGLLVAGPVADAYGVPFWWLLTGILLTLIGIGVLLNRDVMHVEDRVLQPSPALGKSQV